MKTVPDIIKTIERAFKDDPRPCCFHCFGVTSQELCAAVEKHIQENLSKVYTIEDGTCPRKDHQGRVIRPRETAQAAPNYKDKG
jgi:hypothetical protein